MDLDEILAVGLRSAHRVGVVELRERPVGRLDLRRGSRVLHPEDLVQARLPPAGGVGWGRIDLGERRRVTRREAPERHSPGARSRSKGRSGGRRGEGQS